MQMVVCQSFVLVIPDLGAGSCEACTISAACGGDVVTARIRARELRALACVWCISAIAVRPCQVGGRVLGASTDACMRLMG